MSNSLTRETPLLKRGYLTALDPPLGQWFTATFFLIGWLLISLLLATPVSMAAEEKTACDENSCVYPVNRLIS